MAENDRDEQGELYAGVRVLDASPVPGFEARADTAEALFHRAGRGMIALLRGEDRRHLEHVVDLAVDDERRRPPYMTGEWRRVALDAADIESLLLGWLRELLRLYESRGFAYAAARFEILDDHSLVANVGGASEARPPTRAVTGVIEQGLVIVREPHGWRARVTFDV